MMNVSAYDVSGYYLKGEDIMGLYAHHHKGGHCCPPGEAIIDPPQYVVNDYFHPQIVPVIHPIQIINKHHCVPVPHHQYTVQTKDVFCPTDYRAKKGKR